MKNTKMNKILGNLLKVESYMKAFNVKYLMLNGELIANCKRGYLFIYDSRDTRMVSRLYSNILYWDNHTTNKICITGDTMYITKNIMNL